VNLPEPPPGTPRTLKELLIEYHRERGGSVAETVNGVQELSPMFNGIVPHRPGYLAAGRLRRAYVHYYLPVNAEKVSRVLDELEACAPLPARPRVLDFGCGPGTASIPLLRRRPEADLTLVDVVDEALDDARFFAGLLGARPRALHEPPPGEKFDLILAANVFSEAPRNLENHLADDGTLVVLEPALKTATRRLMEWRDRMAAAGYRVAAPCLRQSPCPMLRHEDLWCHMDVPWPRPGPVAQVDQRLGLSKETLKYAYAAVTRKGRTLADLGGTARVVSNLHREKGKSWAWMCGREGPLCRAEILTRHRSETTAAFFRADRGDVLRMDLSGDGMRSQGPVERIYPLRH
jgi:SAM-dependent methyltransferase